MTYIYPPESITPTIKTLKNEERKTTFSSGSATEYTRCLPAHPLLHAPCGKYSHRARAVVKSCHTRPCSR